jgi:hypothetical protein
MRLSGYLTEVKVKIKAGEIAPKITKIRQENGYRSKTMRKYLFILLFLLFPSLSWAATTQIACNNATTITNALSAAAS